MTDDLRARLKRPEFPRSARYEPQWMFDTLMGPNVLWLAEYLSEAMTIAPDMRVLDLGCGKAASSIFLAREFGATVIATDLWIGPEENQARIDQAGLAGRVVPVHAEAHALPFEQDSFDVIVSLDAYHYFGTDDLYLGTIASFLKPGGFLGIVCPGVREELDSVPEPLKPYWQWEFCSFHSPQWWHRHWHKTGLVEVLSSDFMPDGAVHWRAWNELCAEAGPEQFRANAAREAEMLAHDKEGVLGFTRVVARKA
jgi:cyclopropane fatty-acyl-phospholipid synthase-like methyltransferase